jgi:DNA helicase-2/ATP-dependent DNA helicase PcrA
MKFYDRAEIKDLMAYLKIIYNPNDMIAMKRIINKPTRKIGDKTIEVLDIYREKFDKNYFQIIKNIDEVEELNN